MRVKNIWPLLLIGLAGVFIGYIYKHSAYNVEFKEKTKPRDALFEQAIDSTSDIEQNHRLHEALNILQGEISRLTLQQKHMRDDLNALLASSDILLTNRETGESRESPQEKTPEQLEQETSEQILYLDHEVDTQDVDEVWMADMLDTLETGFEKEELAGLKLVETACGSTLCRLEIQFEPGLPMELGVDKLSIYRDWDGETFFTVDANGRMKLFFARSGHKLQLQR